MSSFLRSVKTGGSSTFSVCLARVPGPSLGSHEPSSGAGAPMSSTTSDGLRADPGEPGTPAQIARRRSQRGIALALGGGGAPAEAGPSRRRSERRSSDTDAQRKETELAVERVNAERAAAGFERTLGADHPSTLMTVGNLANVLTKQGNLDEANAMNERALAGFERTLGADHPHTLMTVNNLAVVLKDQGKLDEAKAMYERALAGRERTLGADHPHTLGTVNNLAGLLNQVGDAAAAAALRERFGCE